MERSVGCVAFVVIGKVNGYSENRSRIEATNRRLGLVENWRTQKNSLIFSTFRFNHGNAAYLLCTCCFHTEYSNTTSFRVD
jgi:hypothetical protein